MAVFKCKMCGGTIEFEPGASVGVCDSCGTKQTLPKVDDDTLANLFNRANNLRLKCEFDKAEQIYEKIVQQNDSLAEAHWGIVLCKYGIEYVEDPKTGKRVPTCHRTLFDAVTADADYLAAVDYSDALQQTIYESEARAIDKIQKSILEIVRNEKPFDVFICYKEADENGKRTVDSVIANDIYYQLTQEGFKVFYAAITLEDKLGQEYEPYIFAALNSAKVMLAIGTKPEYFNAVWVKNEWSRFMKLMKTDRSKLLIPCYKDMDAYDLPEEFAHLQAQDMGKIGFINDVVRGIKKVLDSEKKPEPRVVKETVIRETASAPTAQTNIAPLLKRAFMFLEDGDWRSANEYCEKVLDQDPENAQAYLGKLMAEMEVNRKSELGVWDYCFYPLEHSLNYRNLIKFADKALKKEIEGYNSAVIKEADKLYGMASKIEEEAISPEDYLTAAEKFDEISCYKDAENRAELCRQTAEQKTEDIIKQHRKTKFLVIFLIISILLSYASNNSHIVFLLVIILLVFIVKTAIRKNRRDMAANNITECSSEDDEDESNIYCFCPYCGEEVIREFIGETGTNVYCSHCRKVFEYTSIEINDNECESFPEFGKMKDLDVGDVFPFGAYGQKNNNLNAREAIKWIVLDVKEGKALLISKFALDCKPYNEKNTDVTWEMCSLRKWLNNIFLNNAFSDEEKKMIVTSRVTADKNPNCCTDAGKDTSDKVFLLSIEEAKKYFKNKDSRICAATAYAKEHGAYCLIDGNKTDSKDNCWWWLRSPGFNQSDATGVDDDGSLDVTGVNVDITSACVRPALWVNLE